MYFICLKIIDVLFHSFKESFSFLFLFLSITSQKRESYEKTLWFRPGSNRRPSACKADVITATPRNLCESVFYRTVNQVQYLFISMNKLFYQLSIIYLISEI